jgi:hypothetical protein
MALTGQAKTDYQRDYMRRRRAKLAQSAGTAQSKRPPEDEQAEPSERDQDDLIERLTQVTRERDQARQELELRAVQPRAAGHDDPGRCFVCHKRRDEVRVMLKFPRPYFLLFLCDECFVEGHQRCNEIIAHSE